ncbi:hypothetical protein EYR40_006592 [Pleurotus pulmonarius]|nr:hypothetical protein EYR36_011213 [Pleurotus pulmonarius]KAF4599498.1 hypothetical protein EYR40_006592 [Pleurotus pulmonarius]
MAHPRDERFYSSVGKQRRTPPVGDTGGFFATGQGGRTVLPPLSSAFPTTSRFPVPQPFTNQYAQPRSSPGRYDYNQGLYNQQWPNASGVAPQHTPSYNYEYSDPRYTLQPSTYTSYPTRTSPPIPDVLPDPRRLAPLQPGRDDKQWQTSTYSTGPSNNHIRSPTASYPNQYYQSDQSHSYSYAPMNMNHAHHGTSISPHHASSVAPPRVASPYAESSSQPYTPPPVSPTTDEPMIKKKRKRADAAQLKVLNDVYSRTAFPSTEERLSLAKQLDMSPRSVQIWFQNKRQSMRQTNRQSSTMSSSTHQPFSISSGPDPSVDDMLHSNMGFGSSSMSVAGSSYGMTRTSPDPTRSMMHSTSPTVAPRRPGSSGDDSRKWNTRGY